jgi:hypothetical protein
MQQTPFACSVCGLTFDEQQWAKECEAWCHVHESCNLAITAYARERRTTTEGRKQQPPVLPKREQE